MRRRAARGLRSSRSCRLCRACMRTGLGGPDSCLLCNLSIFEILFLKMIRLHKQEVMVEEKDSVLVVVAKKKHQG